MLMHTSESPANKSAGARRTKFNGPSEIGDGSLIVAFVIKDDGPIVKCVAVARINFDRFVVVGDGPISIALIFSGGPAIKIRLGHRTEFDRSREVADCPGIVCLTLAD